MTAYPWRREADGVRLAVRVTPRASKSAVAGILEGVDGHPALAVKLAAPPVDGAANAALVKFLADVLDLPRSRVSIRSGQTARVKLLRLEGDSQVIVERLERLIRG